MNGQRHASIHILHIICFLLFLLITGSCNNKSGESSFAQFKITFHDTRVDGSSISRIDMTVVETQIIDINGNKTTISTQPQSFNLLEIAKNNPVVLADTTIAPGTYTQIRIILDANTSITLTDGTKHILKVPSGEQTGIKIDGLFSIPDGKFYTLDIDLDPGHSVIYTPGQGYMLKPVIEITGSAINSGNFFYAGSYNSASFVAALLTDGSIAAKTAQYPKYLITGYYTYDSVNSTLLIIPQQVTCPDCSRWERLKMGLFADVPPATTYDVVTFGSDFVDLRDPSTGALNHLIKVPSFDLENVSPIKEFTVEVAVPQTVAVGNTIFAQLIPESGEGSVFSAVDTIPDTYKSSFDFRLPLDDFNDAVKDYILLLAVVPSQNDLTLRSDGTVVNMENVVAQNTKNAILLHVHRDEVVTAPLQVPFIPSN